MKRAILIACVLALTACDRAAQQSGPTADELLLALRADADDPIIDASVGACEPGTLQGTQIEVQVCEICFAAVEAGGGLRARRGAGSATFIRAISVDQPNVQPAAGERGVFVASISMMARLRMLQDDRVPLPDEMLARVGYRRSQGFNPTAFIEGVSDDVTERIEGDPELQSEIAALLPPCSEAGAPERRRPVRDIIAPRP